MLFTETQYTYQYIFEFSFLKFIVVVCVDLSVYGKGTHASIGGAVDLFQVQRSKVDSLDRSPIFRVSSGARLHRAAPVSRQRVILARDRSGVTWVRERINHSECTCASERVEEGTRLVLEVARETGIHDTPISRSAAALSGVHTAADAPGLRLHIGPVITEARSLLPFALLRLHSISSLRSG